MERYHLPAGSIFELNNQSKHYVSNWGEEGRIHLIFDYVEEDMPRPPLEVCPSFSCYLDISLMFLNRYLTVARQYSKRVALSVNNSPILYSMAVQSIPNKCCLLSFVINSHRPRQTPGVECSRSFLHHSRCSEKWHHCAL